MTNKEKLEINIGNEHLPFIALDVETTGVMNGNTKEIWINIMHRNF